MIIGAEVAMFVMGLYALIKGRLMTNKKAKFVVEGWPARVIGVICLLPIPMAIAVGILVAAIMVAQGKQVTEESFRWVGIAIEGSIVLICAITAGILARVYRTPVIPVAKPTSGPPVGYAV